VEGPGPIEFRSLRQDYEGEPLSAAILGADPLLRLRAWLDEARRAGLAEPNAMTLATVGGDGQPSARIVLLKLVDDRGLVFATHYGSRKALELEANDGRCAIVFHWQPLHRQVRIEGLAARATAAESDAIFRQRPRGAQIGAWSSPQSRPVCGRDVLDEAARELGRRFPDAVPRPDFWGAYRVQPSRIEFWAGRPDRLHDRFLYEREADGWSVGRLAP
jgi:pyridoxamine 5'-phosphate oxidase